MKTKEWKTFEGSECPRCGDVAEVLTKSKKKNWINDGEGARCANCGLTGYVSVEDSECADVVWSDFDEEVKP